MSLIYGEMFAGYGGLGMGVQSVLGGEMAWCAEVDPAPVRILAHHWPDVPNLGDVTRVDWDTVPKVDVLTGGFPCQDVSHAGKRLGLRPGTRTGLWSHMAYAIDKLQPSLVVAENVRGLLSAQADGDLEPCPWCVGDGPSGALRALGAVLGDLADLRYDTWWCGLRAADVGAAHGRFRVFVFATPADAVSGGWDGWAPEQVGRSFGGAAAAGGGEVPGDLTLLPTPRTSDTNGAGAHGDGGMDLRTVTTTLLPTPPATPGYGLRDWSRLQDWREYEAAIRRHETAFGCPAPLPTQPGRNGQPRLSPTFVEWLMGLPAGHVTDVPGLTRNDQLKALGNGVVPQQAAAATRAFLEFMAGRWAA